MTTSASKSSSPQQYCLKWNNFQSNLSDVFQNMLTNENLVDVTVACEGASLKAHRMVLAACSPYFQNLFIANPCKHPIVILKDVRFTDLKAIIDFMYRGEVNVSQEQINSLLKTAEMLKVKGLAEVSEKQSKGNQIFHANVTRTKKRKRNRHKITATPPTSRVPAQNDVDSDGENGPVNKMRNEGESLVNHMSLVQKQTFQPNQQPGNRLNITSVSDSVKSEVMSNHSEDIEPSKLLEQSMSTPDIDDQENSHEGVLVTPDVHQLHDEDEDENIREIDFMDEFSMPSDTNDISLPGTSNQEARYSYQEYEQMLAGIQRNNLTVCPVCAKEFLKKSKLIRHYHTHFSNYRPKFSCGQCGKLFTTQDWCKRHAVNCQSKISSLAMCQ